SVRAAAATACADEFIEALPGRYSTELGERGAKLSTGQRQRISIARAVAKDAPILILDEPTASLDVDTERAVLERLTVWGRDKVIFLITHRIRTIRRADQVLFVEHGAVVEQGSHDALMNYPDGRYRAFASRESLAAINSNHA
ncbi:MAG: ATP-binding cassette domain-containing protein, partial [Gammaproteobacteria bacterium]|nr:ATP-binding cassette domain-containing protein [Gammaproteobacteria bacterium]